MNTETEMRRDYIMNEDIMVNEILTEYQSAESAKINISENSLKIYLENKNSKIEYNLNFTNPSLINLKNK